MAAPGPLRMSINYRGSQGLLDMGLNESVENYRSW